MYKSFEPTTMVRREVTRNLEITALNIFHSSMAFDTARTSAAPTDRTVLFDLCDIHNKTYDVG